MEIHGSSRSVFRRNEGGIQGNENEKPKQSKLGDAKRKL